MVKPKEYNYQDNLGYNNNVEREYPIPAPELEGVGYDIASSPADMGENVIDGRTIGDLTISNWMRSTNYKPKKHGFLIHGRLGYIECMQLYVGSGGIVGGRLDIPDYVTNDSFHVDTTGNMWIGINSSGPITSAPAYILKDGTAKFTNVEVTGTSTVGGRLATTLGGAINVGGDLINDIINSRLNTQTEEILGDYDFGATGSLVMANDANNGIWLSPTGILGKKSGTPTFTITTSGDATFAGELSSAFGTFGIITAGTIQGSTTYNVAAPGAINMFEAAIYFKDSGGTTQGYVYGDVFGGTQNQLKVIAANTSGGTGGNVDLFLDASSGKVKIFATEFLPVNGAAQSSGSVTYPWDTTYTKNIYLGASLNKLLTVDFTNQYLTFAGQEVIIGHTNLGTGSTIGNQLNDKLTFKSLKGGTGISLTSTVNDITINATSTGTVTQVNTSGAITGGPITTTGTIQHSTSAGYVHLPAGTNNYQMLYNDGANGGVWTSNLYVNGSSSNYISWNGTFSNFEFTHAIYINGQMRSNASNIVLNGVVYQRTLMSSVVPGGTGWILHSAV